MVRVAGKITHKFFVFNNLHNFFKNSGYETISFELSSSFFSGVFMSKQVKARLSGKSYTIAIEPPGRGNWAIVDSKRKRISLSPHLGSRGRLSKIIHESMHVSFPDLSEQAVIRAEKEIMAAIRAYWRLEKLLTSEHKD